MSDAVGLPRLPSLPSVTQKSFLEADPPPTVRGPGLHGGRQGAGVEKATLCRGASDAPRAPHAARLQRTRWRTCPRSLESVCSRRRHDLRLNRVLMAARGQKREEGGRKVLSLT